MNGDPNLPPKPTLWQRIKNGVSHAIGYIPRGIVLTGIVFATSAALSGVGMDFLGITKLAAPEVADKFAYRLTAKFLTHLAIGSALSGLIGATMAPCTPCESKETSTNILAAPFKLSENERALGQQITQSAGSKLTELAQHAAADAVVPGSGTALQMLPFLNNNTQSKGR